LFTLVLVILVLKTYLFLNVENYSALSWYFVSGVLQLVDFAVIVAAIHFLLGIYQIHSRRVISLGFLIVMLIGYGLIFSPMGAVLDVETRTIRLGTGYQVASILYIVSFTFMLALGYGLIGRLWRTDKRNFMISFLIFGTVGYGETLINLPGNLSSTIVSLATESGFLYSSIPYALYGIFLINYFLHYPIPVVPESNELSEDFLSRYGITGREGEIIRKVVQGKSNADIAAELFISLATVKTHLHNIYQKMGVDSRYDLLARVRSGK
jgi:DNA-binding CsgD family transcriptional regulator